ncbi:MULTISPECIES: copper chaperone PCu(A)C [Aliivibrio]|uniref:Copper chaperone PCu(A)C n=1 Tax=Aliivibrio finisterrensis TaxID=511998 RepID=A0A4Q5L009_9GAMM|nr:MULTISPECIES: copper chaperone PCu(A)C [Aliivibrio]MDD9177207.1 copper chaperone PCu(A)C [Aliivibrio sp. A6]RYU51830.1 copper chaperone PCu(A)C [Aliivibrio finisterrensis]RYU54700.1 copper chaperone PCu(A)C [Aliivibrio finisterrensis]RYU57632.1 copper chaperone PCu(A)C [Aliivibrio finisterrensis]RYU66917.1 copper chaperone PCu(A)C [Aliivibrio finisterrensis]
MKKNIFALSALLLSSTAFAQSELTIENPYTRATPPNAVNSAIFMTIKNDGDKDRTLVSATTSAANKVELHTVIKTDGMMKMREVESITIAKNSDTILKPGGLHIMLFELTGPLKEEEFIDVNLNFANGDKEVFKAPVKKVMAGMKHKM